MTSTTDLYGVLAEFGDAASLAAAARAARAAGFRRFDAYSPIPLEDLEDTLPATPGRLPLLTFVGGLLGGLGGYALQYYVAVIANPLNVGGRPLHSWQAYVPVIFEMTILGASLAAVLGMLALNGLPRPHHPLFNVPEFKLASRDRFFLCVEARDPQFDLEKARQFLASLSPRGLWEVPL
jgi:ActD protein